MGFLFGTVPWIIFTLPWRELPSPSHVLCSGPGQKQGLTKQRHCLERVCSSEPVKIKRTKPEVQ